VKISTDNLRSPAALACFFLTAVLGLAADLWTKHLAQVHLERPEPLPSRVVEFIPGWLHFEYTTNRGAVFGMGQGLRWLFLTVSIAAILFLLHLFLTSGRQRLYQFCLGMLLAGVIGNMYDRLRFGEVRDMIHALPGWTWGSSQREVFPWIFNVADSLLCVGVAIILLYSWFVPARRQAAVASSEPAP
jgi:signal peptidase II